MGAFTADEFLARRYDRRRYHCWHLVSDVWERLTGEDLGAVPDRTDEAGELERRPFVRTAGPVEPSIVIMMRPGTVPHAGVYVRGRVMHIRAEGARFERVEDATRGFPEVRFYASRHADRKPAGTGDVGAA